MQNKIFFILLLFVGFILSPNILIAQNVEDSILKVENSIPDSVAEVSSYKEEESEKQKDKVALSFEDARLDTTNVILRLPLNDTIAKLKLQSIYQYHPKNQEAKKQDIKNNSSLPFISEGFLKFIFWFFTIGFLVVIIVLYAMDGSLNVFAKRGKKLQSKSTDEDVFKQNIFDIDYAKLIQQATENSDFNKAARLGFLRILALLHQNKMISYSFEKTNFDYQFQLINTKHYQDFIITSNYYEYAWYSGNVINSNQYNKILYSYQQFEQQLN